MDRCWKGKSISIEPFLTHVDHLFSPPLSARISRSVDDIYNFLGLYFVSLFSVSIPP